MGLAERYYRCYDAIAAADLKEPLERNRRERYQAFKAFIGSLAGLRVLDVGCGDGGFLALLDAHDKVGCDIARPYIDEAAKKGLSVFRHDAAEAYPDSIGRFDVVIANAILEHVLDITPVLRNIRAVLKPGGRLFVLVPWREDLSKYACCQYEFTHLRTFDETSIFEGFRVVRCKGTVPKLPESGFGFAYWLLKKPYRVLKKLPTHAWLKDKLLVGGLRVEPVFMMYELRPLDED